MWQLLFAQFLAINVPLGSVLDCSTAVHIRSAFATCREHGRALAKESIARWRARWVKPRGIFRVHSYGTEERVHAPLAGLGRIVA